MSTEKLITETDSKTEGEMDSHTEQNIEKQESMERNDIDTAISNKNVLKSEKTHVTETLLQQTMKLKYSSLTVK